MYESNDTVVQQQTGIAAPISSCYLPFLIHFHVDYANQAQQSY